MDSLFCFACVCRFALAVKLSLSQPTSFLMFALPILSHILLEVVSEHPCGAVVVLAKLRQGLSFLLGLTHNTL